MSDPATVMIPVDDELAVHVAAATGAAPGSVTASRDANGTLVLDVPLAVWTAAATFLRDRCGLDFFDWLSAVDQPDGGPAGADVVLHVADSRSSGRGRIDRVLLRTRVPDAVGHIPSLVTVWPGAAWHERETFEMFGLVFDGYDDDTGQGLRPLLLPDGFEGTPLRKSFVLAARASKPWPGAKEPGESAGDAPSRRKTLPPGVPDPALWPREAGAPKPDPAALASAPPARAARPPRAARPAREPGAAGAAREPRAPRTPPADGPAAAAPPAAPPAAAPPAAAPPAASPPAAPRAAPPTPPAPPVATPTTAPPTPPPAPPTATPLTPPTTPDASAPDGGAE